METFFEQLAENIKPCPREQEGFSCLLDKGYEICPLSCICLRKRDKLGEMLYSMAMRLFGDSPLVKREMLFWLEERAREFEDIPPGEYCSLKFQWYISKLGFSDEMDFVANLGPPSFFWKLATWLWVMATNLHEYISPNNPLTLI